MPILERLTDQTGTEVVLQFYCPGCKNSHPFRIAGRDPVWQFDGNMEKPTFSPSLLCNQHHLESRCHLFVRGGMIQFLDDCHHELKGQTVPMQEV